VIKMKQVVKNKKNKAKTFRSALSMFFKKNFPNLASEVILPHIVEAIEKLIKEFYPSTENMKPGEIFVIGVDKDERPGYRKSLYDTNMKTCVLPLIADEDIEKRDNGVKLREIKKEKVKRLFLESYKNGVVLTNEDVGNMVSLSSSTISKYVREIEEAKNIVIPRRGTIHDLGPTLTHKVWIIRKIILENKSIEETQRETYHSKEAIKRYIDDFKRVELLYKKNLNPDEIAKSIGKSLKLVLEYINILKKMVEVKNV